MQFYESYTRCNLNPSLSLSLSLHTHTHTHTHTQMGLIYTWCHFTRVKVRPKRARALLTQKTIFFFFLLIIFLIFVVGPPISKKAFTTKAPKNNVLLEKVKLRFCLVIIFVFYFQKLILGNIKKNNNFLVFLKSKTRLVS